MPYPQAVLDIAARINNWGRWGEDDQIGTLNFLTDDVVKEAAQCIRTGKRISLAYPLHKDGLQTGVIPGRVNPLKTMVSLNHGMMGDPDMFHTSDDVVTMGLTQGQNWDLEELAVDCATDGQYDFFLEASPQPFVGGLGSPVNPVAIK